MALLPATVRALVRVALWAYYARVEQEGAEHVPRSGPLLVVANHNNGMVDPMLLIAATERPLSFVAKAPLFRVPVLGAVLRRMGCLPAHRRQDAGYDKARNEALYQAVRGALLAGGAVGIFPEGKSHSEPRLAELRHGAARMALDAEARGGFELGLRILPVGLHFEDTRLFRGRALVRFARPLALDGYREELARDERAAVARLTDEIGARLRERILEAESARLLELADLVERFGILGEEGGGLEGGFLRKQLLLIGQRELRAEHAEALSAFEERVAHYAGRLRRLGVRDEDLLRAYRPGLVLSYALRNSALLALGAPALALGLLANAAPFWASVLAVRVAGGSVDVRASSGLLAAILFFPLWHLGLAWAAYELLGPAWALGVGLLGLPLGLFAVRWLERWRRVGRDARAFWTALRRPGFCERLRGMRAALRAELESLVAAATPAAPSAAGGSAGTPGPARGS